MLLLEFDNQCPQCQWMESEPVIICTRWTSHLRQDRPDDLAVTLRVSFLFFLSKNALQDYMGVLVSWDLGVSPPRAL